MAFTMPSSVFIKSQKCFQNTGLIRGALVASAKFLPRPLPELRDRVLGRGRCEISIGRCLNSTSMCAYLFAILVLMRRCVCFILIWYGFSVPLVLVFAIALLCLLALVPRPTEQDLVRNASLSWQWNAPMPAVTDLLVDKRGKNFLKKLSCQGNLVSHIPHRAHTQPHPSMHGRGWVGG